MSDEIPPPPFVYDGLDPALEEKSVISEVADAGDRAKNRRGGRFRPQTGDAAQRIEQHRPRSAAGIAPDRILAGCRCRLAQIAAAVRAASIEGLYPSGLGIELWNAVILGANDGGA